MPLLETMNLILGIAVLALLVGASILSVALARKHAECIRLEARAESEKAAAEARIQTLEAARENLQAEFHLLSKEALAANNRAFLEIAKGELEEKRKAVLEALSPVSKQIVEFGNLVHKVEKERTGDFAQLRQQLTNLAESQASLGKETSNLVTALRAPQTRGRWGEITLRRVVELAGMQEHCDFTEQHSVRSESGVLRPDLLIHLPGGKKIVVDSKVAIDAYMQSLEAPDEAARIERLRHHARQVRTHVERLASKNYWSQFEDSPEVVVMFLPLETAFSAAVENDPGLLEWAVERRVVPSSPMTLVALLQAVHYGWRQESMSEHARKIGALGRELHDRIAVFATHFARVGKNLQDATKCYNDAVGSMERMVLSKARELKACGAGSADKTVPELQEVDLLPREIRGNSEDLPASPTAAGASNPEGETS